MDPETRVFQAADGEDLVILACTVFFEWSTRVTDKQTDRELRWLRCAKAVAAFARKNLDTFDYIHVIAILWIFL